ncbi:MAG: polysulfide reductase NrfD [Coriobacteriaceae bacterium]|nr:polysulfide reductase NrfD [Coriobacteriaceae bacterium]
MALLSDLVVVYLFLGGAGSGAVLVLALGDLLSPKALLLDSAKPGYRRFFSPAFSVALLALMVSAVCLLADLGRIDRVSYLFLHPRLSYLTLGVYALVSLVLLTGVTAALWNLNIPRMPRLALHAVEAASAIVAGVVMLYTGLLLQSIAAVAFWATPFVPTLFVLSSVSSGIALVTLVQYLVGQAPLFPEPLRRLCRVEGAFLSLEALLAAVFLGLACIQPEARQSADYLLFGAGSQAFWGGFVLCGLVVPCALEAVSPRIPAARYCALPLAVLAGAFALRWCVAWAGMTLDTVASALQGLTMSTGGV